ncbi:hypothetical protein N2152v2_005778 [Parachlorella kessleri]
MLRRGPAALVRALRGGLPGPGRPPWLSPLRWASTAASDVPDATEDERESMHFDVCVVGAGPAGLSAAIRFKQLCQERDRDYTVCVIEKGAEVGSHILSGNVFDPRALNNLLPNWRDDPDCPVRTPAAKDKFMLLTKSMALRLPNPPQMKNKGNYIISLSETVRWLGRKAEEAGVEIYPGFAGSKVAYGKDGSVQGVVTGDFGVAKDGSRKEGYTLGMALTAQATLFAEGARGSLSQEVIKHFKLREKVGASPQSYALGIKEVWEVPADRHQEGLVVHTVGYPLPWNVYGGSFIYHMSDNRVALGLVTALDYSNPYLNLYQEFQQFKRHPSVSRLLDGGTCLQYGARTLNEGGLQSLPGLAFPGGALIGCSAGFLNVPKIKGTHTAMQSGIMAAEAAFSALEASPPHHVPVRRPLDLSAYERAIRESWVVEELHRARNLRPAFAAGGLWGGIAYSALDTYLLRGRAPWTFKTRSGDHEHLKPAALYSPKNYPKPDGKITFDLSTSLFRSGTNHEHDQPAHLRLRNAKLPQVINWPLYKGPESRYCPAGVYEYVPNEATGEEQLQINAQNCLHCKACDVKDPLQNIHWTPPEGGGGPNYTIT